MLSLQPSVRMAAEAGDVLSDISEALAAIIRAGMGVSNSRSLELRDSQCDCDVCVAE
jgi:hypothetical protein